MTTITIKNGKKLKKNVFQTFEDFIEAYYASKNTVVLHQIDFKDLPANSQQDIEESKAKGREGLVNFQG